jgi:hypothetical protein
MSTHPYFYNITGAGATSLYLSDGTAAGTTLVRSGLGSVTFPAGSGAIAPAGDGGGGAFFLDSNRAIYRTGVTPAGTELVVSNGAVLSLATVGRTAYYQVGTTQSSSGVVPFTRGLSAC